MNEQDFNSVLNKVFEHRRAGKFGEALDEAYKLREIAREFDGYYQAEADLTWAEAQHNIDPADDRIKEIGFAVLKAYEEIDNVSGILRCWILLGLKAQHHGDTETTESYYKQVISLAKKRKKFVDSPEYEIAALINLAVLLDKEGRVKEAKETFEQILEREKAHPSERIRMIALLNLGGLYDSTGNSINALGCVKEALNLAENQEDIATQARAYLMAGDIYNNLGNTEEAFDNYQSALRASGKSGEPAAFANSLSALSFFHSTEREDPDAALSLSQKALEFALQAGDPDAEAAALRSLGTAYVHKGEDKKARKSFEKALKVAKEAKHLGLQLNLNTQLGAIELREGKGEKALKHYAMARRLAFEIGNLDLKGRAVLSIASCHLSLRNGAEAYESLVESANLMEAYRESIDDEQLSLRIRKFLIENYTMLMLLFHMLPDDDDPRRVAEIFELADRMKNRLILDHYHKLPRRPSATVPKHLIEEEQELREEMTKLADLPAHIDPILQVEKAYDLKDKIDNTLDRISDYDESYVQSCREPIVSVDRIIDEYLAKHPKTAIAQYFISDDVSFVVLLKPRENPSYFSLDIKPAEISGCVTRLHRTFNGDPDSPIPIPGLPPDYPWSRNLDFLMVTGSRLLPFLEHLGGMDSIVIVPHGSLHSIPWAALQVDGEYLVDKLGVYVSPSVSILMQCERIACQLQGQVPEKTIVLSVPCRQDADWVSAFRDETWLLDVLQIPSIERTIDIPFRKWLIEALSEANLVHFSCHGIFKKDNPLSAGFLVGNGITTPDRYEIDFDKEVLTAKEIMQLRMKARLIVARACRSGEVLSTLGDEIQGLTRAFLYAGVPTVLNTLWNNSIRSSRVLLEEFYQRFISGMPAWEALYKAQKSLRTGKNLGHVWREEWSHPFHWGVFQILGYGDTIWNREY